MFNMPRFGTINRLIEVWHASERLAAGSAGTRVRDNEAVDADDVVAPARVSEGLIFNNFFQPRLLERASKVFLFRKEWLH